MELLISKGARINEKNFGGWTALMFASYRGHPECMELLIQKGAKATVMDNVENTAMTIAKNEETREILVKAPKIRRAFLKKQKGEAGPVNAAVADAGASGHEDGGRGGSRATVKCSKHPSFRRTSGSSKTPLRTHAHRRRRRGRSEKWYRRHSRPQPC